VQLPTIEGWLNHTHRVGIPAYQPELKFRKAKVAANTAQRGLI
jgi:hypothetical protein